MKPVIYLQHLFLSLGRFREFLREAIVLTLQLALKSFNWNVSSRLLKIRLYLMACSAW